MKQNINEILISKGIKKTKLLEILQLSRPGLDNKLKENRFSQAEIDILIKNGILQEPEKAKDFGQEIAERFEAMFREQSETIAFLKKQLEFKDKLLASVLHLDTLGKFEVVPIPTFLNEAA